ncbi:hypothetical protein [Saccharomonospora sp. CUA-673]|nr:hypothetical protein [Saccharomonospora sp. CUA-673]
MSAHSVQPDQRTPRSAHAQYTPRYTKSDNDVASLADLIAAHNAQTTS